MCLCLSYLNCGIKYLFIYLFYFIFFCHKISRKILCLNTKLGHRLYLHIHLATPLSLSLSRCLSVCLSGSRTYIKIQVELLKLKNQTHTSFHVPTALLRRSVARTAFGLLKLPIETNVHYHSENVTEGTSKGDWKLWQVIQI